MKRIMMFLVLMVVFFVNYQVLTQDCQPEGTTIGSYQGVDAHSNGGNYSSEH